MKLRYVKFSDERRKEFCIKTIIAEDNGKLRVYKKAIFEEGEKHIRSIADNAALLRKYYDTDVCNVVLDKDTACFDYIKGESMEKRYIAAMKGKDIAEIKRLLVIHKDIILGKKENETVFSHNAKTEEVFGDCGMFEGMPALKCCNYDAIAGNIMFVDDKPVFIDYEWVFECPVPTDVALYHCIHNFYEHYPEMEEVFPFESAMAHIGVKSDQETLSKTYLSFFDYVISDGVTEGFALMEAICLKNTKTLKQLNYENIVNMCECDRLQKVISDINGKLIEKMNIEMQFEALKQCNDEMSRRNLELEQKILEYDEDLQKNICYVIAKKTYRKLKSIGRMICKRE